MPADRPINFTDIYGVLSNASDGQKAQFRAALGFPSDGVADDFLKWTGTVYAWQNPIAFLESQDPDDELDATAIKGLSSVAQAPNYAASIFEAYAISDGDVIARAGSGFGGITAVPDTPATALQIAAGTDEATSFNPKNNGLWMKQSTLTYATTATIDWSGAMSGSSLSGHSRNVLMSATGNSDIRVGGICPGMEGKPFLIGVVNSGGGSKTIDFITYAASGGAIVELAAGVTNPGLGEDAGDELWAVGFITTVGTTLGVWKICRFIQKNAD